MGKRNNYSKLQFIQRAAEVNLTYTAHTPIRELPVIKTSQDAVRYLRTIYDPRSLELRESFYVVCLNRNNRVVACYRVSEGGISGTVADNKLIFACALLTASCSVIVSHNHPSGNLTPSRADENLTRKIKQGCEVLDMSLIDHIIVTENSYFSFADEGLL